MFRQATRLAEARLAEVAAAMSALTADNETFRDRVEAQLSEKYEKRREHLLISSVQTLDAMDRAIEAARNSDATEALISGVMLVRTQLFRILQEEGLERVSVLGLPFDQRSAEAVKRGPVTDPDQDGLVIEELQGGHQLSGHIVRRAKVVVGEFVPASAESPVVIIEETRQPAAPESPTPIEGDDFLIATMDLGTAASMFMPPPVMPPPVNPPPTPGPKETQSVPREPRPSSPVAEPPSSARGTGAGAHPLARPALGGSVPPRLRTGPVPPPRDRSPVYEAAPTSPPAPAAPRPPTPTHPGVAAAPPTRGRRGIKVALAVAAAALLAAVVIGWWVLGRRPKPPAAGGQVAEASPLAASPVAVAPPPVIPEDVTVVAPSTLARETGAAGTQAPGPGRVTPATAAPPAATPPPVKAAPAPARPTPPPPPVNPVPALLSQADRAMTAKRYDEAISRFNEVLKLEPENPEAASGKLQALGERASIGRYFLTAVTMSEGKASGGGIKGFDGGSVVKSQCECALTYEVTPANPSQGQPYTVSIFLRNDSKKDIKPQSITAAVNVNGWSSNRPLSLATKQIPRGQKTLVAKLEDTWKPGTTSWSMEAAVGAGGNTYRAQLTWELRVPRGQ